MRVYTGLYPEGFKIHVIPGAENRTKKNECVSGIGG